MPRVAPKNASGFLSAGKRIYAIGDIHATLQPLQKLHDLIAAEEKKLAPSVETLMIYLGDYIDRGHEATQVVDYLIARKESQKNCIFLKGNHEHALLQFLVEPDRYAEWLQWGGLETITSYGIDPFEIMGKPDALQEIAVRLKDAIPPEHMHFYHSLKLMHEEDGYVFVHAGIRPEISLAQQNTQDLLNIRREFLDTEYPCDKTVVFGHTIFQAPYQKSGRIGIDTGAYMTGKLTCAVLEGDQVRFLTS